MTEPRNKSPVRFALIASLLILPTQFAFCLLVEEPYPALMMPGFPGSCGSQGDMFRYLNHEIVLIADDGTERQITVEEFLPWMGVSQKHVLLRFFNHQPPSDERRLLHQGRLLASVFPGWRVGTWNRGTPATETGLSQWVLERAQRQVGPAVRAVEVRWYQDTYDWNAKLDRVPLGAWRTTSDAGS